MLIIESKSFSLVLLLIAMCSLVCESTSAAYKPSRDKTDDHATELAIAYNFLDQCEPWIRSSDFEEFIHSLALPNELKKVAMQRWEQYESRVAELKSDVAEVYRKGFVSKLVESDGYFVKWYGLDEAINIIRVHAKRNKQIIRKFSLLSSDFLEELRLQLNIHDDTWSKAVMWLRRQRLLRGEFGQSWTDLSTLPDLMSQFERFIREDEDFLPLVEPTSTLDKETIEIVHAILEDWALQTDAFVDSYLIGKVRRCVELRLASRMYSDKKNWLTAFRNFKKDGFRRYRFFWSTSEYVASVIEPVVGPWAAERWRRATELVIFPESCPTNSFEQIFPAILETLSLPGEKERILQLLLPLERKLVKVRASMREVTLWYAANLDPKYAGYEVPTLSADVQEIDGRYQDTIDAMIDVLAEAIPTNNWDAVRENIKQLRNYSSIDRYVPRARDVANFLASEENQLNSEGEQ